MCCHDVMLFFLLKCTLWTSEEDSASKHVKSCHVTHFCNAIFGQVSILCLYHGLYQHISSILLLLWYLLCTCFINYVFYYLNNKFVILFSICTRTSLAGSRGGGVLFIPACNILHMVLACSVLWTKKQKEGVPLKVWSTNHAWANIVYPAIAYSTR